MAEKMKISPQAELELKTARSIGPLSYWGSFSPRKQSVMGNPYLLSSLNTCSGTASESVWIMLIVRVGDLGCSTLEKNNKNLLLL